MNQIELHIGPRKCGKSLHVEKKMMNHNKLLYIATLPDKKEYLDTIDIHQKRRGNKWKTLEISYNSIDDINNILLNIKNFDKNSACMIDGIWTWFHFQNKLGNTISVIDFANNLINIIKGTENHWYLVDINYYNHFKGLKMIHEKLIKDLHIVNIINWIK